MSIRRYNADADTTITNAYKANLSTRATGSNMGESDILEVFNIYAQASSSSSEMARVLIKFPTDSISTDRTSGIIPASGTVSFFLKLYNAEHPYTTPTNFTIDVSSVTREWDEGHGLDMEEYSDMGAAGTGTNTFGGTGASWNVASAGVDWSTEGGDYGQAPIITSTDTVLLLQGNGTTIIDSSTSAHTPAVTGNVQIETDAAINAGRENFGSSCIKFDGTGDYLSLSDSSDWTIAGDFTIDFWIRFNHLSKDHCIIAPKMLNQSGYADGLRLIWSFNNLSWHLHSGTTPTLPQGNALFPDAISTDTWYHVALVRKSNVVKLYRDGVQKGTNFSNTDATNAPDGIWIGRNWYDINAHLDSLDGYLDEFRITNGTALWDSPFTPPIAEVGTPPLSGYTASSTFEDGDEDLDVDITAIVENWILGSGNGGFANHGLMIKLNSTFESGTTSFYTKKFFGRGTEFFYKQPTVEARWNNSEADDRANFYSKSNLRTNNNNVISIKNYVDGVLTNIPSLSGSMTIKFYETSAKAVEVSSESVSVVESSGVYKATVVVETLLSQLYASWQDAGGTEYHTESITVKQRKASSSAAPTYVTAIKNLKKSYSDDEIARFRLFIRLKDWSPTIYNVATKELQTEVVESAYYKIVRVTDELTVIDYGKDTIEYTKLSYDSGGCYFDLDMSLLETGWAYRIEFMYKINGETRQQPETFKFRVE